MGACEGSEVKGERKRRETYARGWVVGRIIPGAGLEAVLPEAVLPSLGPESVVDVTPWPHVEALAVIFPLLPLAVVLGAVDVRHLSPSVSLVVLPRSAVRRAVRVGARAFAVLGAGDPGAFVDAAVGVGHGALSGHFVLDPVPFVDAALGSRVGPDAVLLAVFDLSRVGGPGLEGDLSLAPHLPVLPLALELRPRREAHLPLAVPAHDLIPSMGREGGTHNRRGNAHLAVSPFADVEAAVGEAHRPRPAPLVVLEVALVHTAARLVGGVSIPHTAARRTFL
mmetsp:Transcript_26514/g.85789  ORF Transcript_26514/g.85789 Transcript_26514/m.85789 type:complete len:281 (+) Transcript_26514:728-1570(+)